MDTNKREWDQFFAEKSVPRNPMTGDA